MSARRAPPSTAPAPAALGVAQSRKRKQRAISVYFDGGAAPARSASSTSEKSRPPDQTRSPATPTPVRTPTPTPVQSPTLARTTATTSTTTTTTTASLPAAESERVARRDDGTRTASAQDVQSVADALLEAVDARTAGRTIAVAAADAVAAAARAVSSERPACRMLVLVWAPTRAAQRALAAALAIGVAPSERVRVGELDAVVRARVRALGHRVPLSAEEALAEHDRGLTRAFPRAPPDAVATALRVLHDAFYVCPDATSPAVQHLCATTAPGAAAAAPAPQRRSQTTLTARGDLGCINPSTTTVSTANSGTRGTGSGSGSGRGGGDDDVVSDRVVDVAQRMYAMARRSAVVLSHDAANKVFLDAHTPIAVTEPTPPGQGNGPSETVLLVAVRDAARPMPLVLDAALQQQGLPLVRIAVGTCALAP